MATELKREGDGEREGGGGREGWVLPQSVEGRGRALAGNGCLSSAWRGGKSQRSHLEQTRPGHRHAEWGPTWPACALTHKPVTRISRGSDFGLISGQYRIHSLHNRRNAPSSKKKTEVETIYRLYMLYKIQLWRGIENQGSTDHVRTTTTILIVWSTWFCLSWQFFLPFLKESW